MFARAIRYSLSVISVACFWRFGFEGGTFATLDDEGAVNNQGFVRFS